MFSRWQRLKIGAVVAVLLALALPAGHAEAGGQPSITLTVTPASVVEDSATGVLSYTFALNRATTSTVSVSFSVAGTAAFGTDYTQSGATTFGVSTGTIQILGGTGQTQATVDVDPTADTTVEPDETVILTITSSTNATVGDPSAATGSITDDDLTAPPPAAPARAAALPPPDSPLIAPAPQLPAGPLSVSAAPSEPAPTALAATGSPSALPAASAFLLFGLGAYLLGCNRVVRRARNP